MVVSKITNEEGNKFYVQIIRSKKKLRNMTVWKQNTYSHTKSSASMNKMFGLSLPSAVDNIFNSR